MYDNVVNKFLWGGLDTAKPGEIYLDETICRMVTTLRSALLDLAANLSNEATLAKDGKLTIPKGMTLDEYVADRYKKSKHILDLMMEKLPTAICPFTVQMGEQVAYVYYSLGISSGDDTCVAKSNKMLEDEIMRYGSYLRFYQSLDAAQYSRLTSTDKYIDQQYMINMLADYGQQCGQEKYTALVKKLAASGVNMDRLNSYQEAYQRSRQQQAAAQQAPEAEAESGELGEMLGN